jgi:hypothetical protein
MNDNQQELLNYMTYINNLHEKCLTVIYSDLNMNASEKKTK